MKLTPEQINFRVKQLLDKLPRDDEHFFVYLGALGQFWETRMSGDMSQLASLLGSSCEHHPEFNDTLMAVAATLLAIKYNREDLADELARVAGLLKSTDSFSDN